MPAQPIYTYTWKLRRLADAMRDLPPTIYLKECGLPDFNVEIESYNSPNIVYKFAKRLMFNDVKATFYDTTGLKDVFLNLLQNIWSPNEGIRPAIEYRFDSLIQVFKADGQSQEVEWKLVNSWVSNIAWGQLTYTSSDMHVVTATITYDWAEKTSDTDSNGNNGGSPIGTIFG